MHPKSTNHLNILAAFGMRAMLLSVFFYQRKQQHEAKTQSAQQRPKPECVYAPPTTPVGCVHFILLSLVDLIPMQQSLRTVQRLPSNNPLSFCCAIKRCRLMQMQKQIISQHSMQWQIFFVFFFFYTHDNASDFMHKS